MLPEESSKHAVLEDDDHSSRDVTHWQMISFRQAECRIAGRSINAAAIQGLVLGCSTHSPGQVCNVLHHAMYSYVASFGQERHCAYRVLRCMATLHHLVKRRSEDRVQCSCDTWLVLTYMMSGQFLTCLILSFRRDAVAEDFAATEDQKQSEQSRRPVASLCHQSTRTPSAVCALLRKPFGSCGMNSTKPRISYSYRTIFCEILGLKMCLQDRTGAHINGMHLKISKFSLKNTCSVL